MCMCRNSNHNFNRLSIYLIYTVILYFFAIIHGSFIVLYTGDLFRPSFTRKYTRFLAKLLVLYGVSDNAGKSWLTFMF